MTHTKKMGVVGVAVGILVFLSNCQTGPMVAMQEAETVDQKAGAFLYQARTVVKTAHNITRMEHTPDAVVFAIEDAYNAAEPLIIALQGALIDFQGVDAEIQAIRDRGLTPSAEDMLIRQEYLESIRDILRDTQEAVRNLQAAGRQSVGEHEGHNHE